MTNEAAVRLHLYLPRTLTNGDSARETLDEALKWERDNASIPIADDFNKLPSRWDMVERAAGILSRQCRLSDDGLEETTVAILIVRAIFDENENDRP